MNIALLGYGRMGQEIERVLIQRGHSAGFITDLDLDPSDLQSCDVAIEFSVPDSAVGNIKKCFSVNVPIVVGTTGWYEEYEGIRQECIDNEHALFTATNFSIGVNLFFQINTRLAELMNGYPEYEVSMKEIHHTQKLDAPSGTGITLAEGIIDRLDRKTSWIEGQAPTNTQLGINSIREGVVPGTHIIEYTSNVDMIEIKHEAKGRKGFALGAVLAAEWIVGKTGVFGMGDMLRTN